MRVIVNSTHTTTIVQLSKSSQLGSHEKFYFLSAGLLAESTCRLLRDPCRRTARTCCLTKRTADDMRCESYRTTDRLAERTIVWPTTVVVCP